MPPKHALLTKSKSVMVRFGTSYEDSVRLAQNADIFGIDLTAAAPSSVPSLIGKAYDRSKSMRRFAGATAAKSKRLDQKEGGPVKSDYLRLLCNVTRAVCLFKRNLKKKDIICVTSLTVEQELLQKISGFLVYEQRSMYQILNLKNARTRLAYVTSVPISPAIVDYYLRLAVGDDPAKLADARSRLLLVDCEDARAQPLSSKMLDRPFVLRELRQWVRQRQCFLKVFLSTALELELAVRLGVPLRANDPSLEYLGSKSGSRTLFAAANVPHPDGWRELSFTEDEALEQMDRLWARQPTVQKIVVKLDYGVSGEGNAVVRMPSKRSADNKQERLAALRRAFRAMEPSAAGETYQGFARQMSKMGVVGECWLEVSSELAHKMTSPSVQGIISPAGQVTIVSTHEQILNGQVYLGCEFPAAAAYRTQLVEYGRRIGEQLAQRGAQSRYACDFMAVPQPDGSLHLNAIEINLRDGGTTHPWETVALVTDGVATTDDARLLADGGRGSPVYYKATDNLVEPEFRGLRPQDFLSLVQQSGLAYNREQRQGSLFHLLGCLSELGKCGMVCVGPSPDHCRELYTETIKTLKQLAANLNSTTGAEEKEAEEEEEEGEEVEERGKKKRRNRSSRREEGQKKKDPKANKKKNG